MADRARADEATALLDVNVLVALFDPVHTCHEAAHEWFGHHRESGWATCPITENGLVRTIANVAYPGSRTSVGDALARLRSFRDSGAHTFWGDTVSLCDPGRISPQRVRGHRQLTDAYLLALAVDNGGRLATFDRRIAADIVAGATARNLVIIRAAG
jgi:hypothetical protein